MHCCSNSESDKIDKFFSKKASSFLETFQKNGFEKSQRHLLAGLSKIPVESKTILEIGCGIGFLHRELVKRGASFATGVDISSEMIHFAEEIASSANLTGKTKYLTGDFTEIYAQIEPADVTVLDKVICCYHDLPDLLEKSAARTRSVYAFTLPREKWYNRTAIAVMSFFRTLTGANFHPFYHRHADIINILNKHHFTRLFQESTFIWESYVFMRNV